MLCSVGSRHFPPLYNSNATKSRPESEIGITGPGPGVTGPPLLLLARALSKLVKCQCFRGCIPSLETWRAGSPALVGRKVFCPYSGLGRGLACIVAGVPSRNRAMLAPGSGVPVESFAPPSLFTLPVTAASLSGIQHPGHRGRSTGSASLPRGSTRQGIPLSKSWAGSFVPRASSGAGVCASSPGRGGNMG